MCKDKKPHRNSEMVVKCPVEGCDAEKLARGMHLHVLRSVGVGHGEQGEIPEGLSFEDLKPVGVQEVEVNYPTEREVEKVARLCPYCGKPFTGKHGVMIHLGQIAGRKNHPPNASKLHEPEDFAVVELDENENVVGVVRDQPENDSGAATDASESEEGPAYAEFTKAQVDYLWECVAETGDERAKRILQRAYLPKMR